MGTDEILNAARTHRVAKTKRHASRKVAGTPELEQANQQIKRLNEELEQRDVERTRELAAANQRLGREIIKRKRAEAQRTRIYRALHLVSNSNRALLRATDKSSYLNEVCQIAVEVGGYLMAWIGFAEHDEDRTVRAVAQSGFETGYLESARITWADRERGRGPVGVAIRTGKPCIVRNIPDDPAFGPWKVAAAQRGYRSLIALPLIGEGRTFGILGVYAAEVDAFDAEEVRLLMELADDLAFGLTLIHMRDEREQNIEALKESERQLAEAQRLAHMGSANWDIKNNVLSWSDEMYRISGLQPQERNLTFESAMEIIHPDDRDSVREVIESAPKTQKPFSCYFRIIRPDGEVRTIHSTGRVVSDEHGNPLRLFSAAEDITERKQAEEKLNATSEQLRALTASLQSAREEEGTRISREIHDELGAALSSLRWDLEDVDNAISESTDLSHPAALRKKIEAMISLTDTTIETVRRIASELRPIALDDLGLIEAIEWHAQQFQARTGIIAQCDWRVEMVNLNQEQSIAVFRIFQEALTNILRHAQATRVDIIMRKEAGELVLTISDNGRGISEGEKVGQQSLGILGMRERAHLVGARVEMTGVGGAGTVVTVRMPISGPVNQ
jgi:PAS domain S-box-containing protein